jgi:hypothetical protein
MRSLSTTLVRTLRTIKNRRTVKEQQESNAEPEGEKKEPTKMKFT